jgi:hypothetical protein
MHVIIIKVSSLQVWVSSSFSLKVKVFPHLKHYNIQPYGGVEVMFHTFMTSARDGDNNWLASLSHHLTTRP